MLEFDSLIARQDGTSPPRSSLRPRRRAHLDEPRSVGRWLLTGLALGALATLLVAAYHAAPTTFWATAGFGVVFACAWMAGSGR